MKRTLFWLWAAFVVSVVIFKLYDAPFERIEYLKELRRMGFDNVNIQPFHTLRICFYNIESAWAVKNLLGNTLPFLILGIISRFTWQEYNRTEVFLRVSSAIILFEIMQYILLLGTCDVDDVILNLAFLKIGFCSLK